LKPLSRGLKRRKFVHKDERIYPGGRLPSQLEKGNHAGETLRTIGKKDGETFRSREQEGKGA